MSAQRGQIFRAADGLWAIRFATRAGSAAANGLPHARRRRAQALEEELRRVRLGPLYRPKLTLRELDDAYLAQYDAAPSTLAFLKDNMQAGAGSASAMSRSASLRVEQIAAWRAALPEGKRYRSHRSLRQVLAAAVRWKWLEDNPAALVKNPEPRAGRDRSVRLVGGDRRDRRRARRDRRRAGPVHGRDRRAARRRRSAREWRDVDLERRMFMVRRAFAKGRLKEYAQDGRLAARGAAARAGRRGARGVPGHRRGILFPAPEGGRIDINNWRNRSWTPALEAAGVKHRRIYDLRHTYATWSLAAGIDIFTLARRMGTSVKMIDRTYGHLVAGADAYERELLDAFDRGASRRAIGRAVDAQEVERCRLSIAAPETTKAPRLQGFCWERERRDSNPRPPA